MVYFLLMLKTSPNEVTKSGEIFASGKLPKLPDYVKRAVDVAQNVLDVVGPAGKHVERNEVSALRPSGEHERDFLFAHDIRICSVARVGRGRHLVVDLVVQVGIRVIVIGINCRVDLDESVPVVGGPVNLVPGRPRVGRPAQFRAARPP